MRASRYNVYTQVDGKLNYVIYNTLSGAIFRANKKGIKIIKKAIREQLDQELVEELKRNGIWVNDKIDERQIFQTLREHYKYYGKRAYLCLYITYKCDLACEYCYLSYFLKGKSFKMMSSKTANAAVEFIKSVVQNNNCEELITVFTGGNPILNVSIILEVLEKLNKWTRKNSIKLKTIIFSNGTSVTKDIINGLSKYKVFFQVTLAGSKEIHNIKRPYLNNKGTYDDIIETLRMLKDQHISFGIRVDVDKQNYESIDEMLEDLKKLIGGGLHIKFFPIIPIASKYDLSWTKNCFNASELGRLSKLWNLAKEKGFNVILTPLVKYVYCDYHTNRGYIIDPLGDVYKCGGVVGIKERRIGTLDHFGNLVKLSHQYYDWMSRNPLTIKNCRNCKFLPACGGGCAGIVYDKYQTCHKENCREKYLIPERIKFYLKGTN